MDFEWDEAKSADCARRRGFDFAFAALIFQGPVVERVDRRRAYGEVRIQAIGAVGAEILFVVYTDRDTRRRIISARMAKAKERIQWRSFVSR